MSSQTGRGGMGSHKHGVSGVVRPNTRARRQLGYEVQRKEREEAEARERKNPTTCSSVEELMRKERRS